MKPRVPPPTPEHLGFLEPYGAEITALALATRTLVFGAALEATELIYDAYNAVASGYSFTGRPSDAFIHIAVYPRWVNLGFNQGAHLPDPHGRLQGSGRQVRHVRISRTADLLDPVIRALVKDAVARADRPDSQAATAGSSVVRAIYPKRRRPGRHSPGPTQA